MRIVRLLVTLLLLALLAAAYVSLALEWSYSSGERAGWVQKFSRKGWVCKSWEGELALVSLPGSTVEKFYFTVHDAAVAREIQAAVGTRVTLHYEEKVGLPTSCFGDTRYFVDKVTATADIPLGPGVVVPTPASPPSAGAAPPAPASMPAVATPAASPASPASAPQ
jgi:hypothetical protein